MTRVVSRPFAASVLGVAFIVVYVAAATTFVELLPAHWAVQAVYFLVAGIAWVWPIRWLMLWSVGKR